MRSFLLSWNFELKEGTKHLLFQRDDVFVASVLPCQSEGQVVGFRSEVQRGKGYFELLSHHRIHKGSRGRLKQATAGHVK